MAVDIAMTLVDVPPKRLPAIGACLTGLLTGLKSDLLSNRLMVGAGIRPLMSSSLAALLLCRWCG